MNTEAIKELNDFYEELSKLSSEFINKSTFYKQFELSLNPVVGKIELVFKEKTWDLNKFYVKN